METILKTCNLTLATEGNDGAYEYLLAFSSDSLIVLDNNRECVEWIVEGNDVKGIVACADSEDNFLDAILTIKNMILSGFNPVSILNQI